MKFGEKLKAIKLRRLGFSYPEIQKQITVSRSTLSIWLRDISLTADQKNRLFNNSTLALYKEAKEKQNRKIQLTQKIHKSALNESAFLLKTPLFSAGLMLYWAEGAKTLERVKLTNSDPDMIKFMMRWFREICKVPELKFRIGLHIHELHCRKDVEKYWSKLTNIPLTQFHKSYVKKTSLKHRKKILYNGTCNICIFDKNLFRKIHGWQIGFLQHMSR